VDEKSYYAVGGLEKMESIEREVAVIKGGKKGKRRGLEMVPSARTAYQKLKWKRETELFLEEVEGQDVEKGNWEGYQGGLDGGGTKRGRTGQ